MEYLRNKKYSILRGLLKYSFVFVIFVSLFTSVVCFGEGGTTVTPGIVNPLGKEGPQDIPAFIEVILNAILVVGVPIVTLGFIYTGFLFVQAQGNSNKLETAKKSLFAVVIGALLLLGSFVLSKTLKSTVDEIIKNA
jgi:hypothetical protein